MQPYDLDAQALAPVIEKLVNDPEKFVDFRMKFESDIEKPNSARILVRNPFYFLPFFFSIIQYIHNF